MKLHLLKTESGSTSTAMLREIFDTSEGLDISRASICVQRRHSGQSNALTEEQIAEFTQSLKNKGLNVREEIIHSKDEVNANPNNIHIDIYFDTSMIDKVMNSDKDIGKFLYLKVMICGKELHLYGVRNELIYLHSIEYEKNPTMTEEEVTEFLKENGRLNTSSGADFFITNLKETLCS